MQGTLEGHPVVSMTFDPAVSGLEKSLAFPLLISNATSFLLSASETSNAPSHPPFDTSESDIAPRPVPTFETATARANGEPSAANSVNELWPWLAAAALLVLGFEWLAFARRG
jgi:hypothetical protein